MFPLGAVLLPGEPLDLRVFEPRYVQLLRDVRAGVVPPEFGVVLIERGHEVGGGDQRAAVGVLAEIERMSELSPDRFALTCRGTDRFRVRRWLPDDPYPRAELEFWPDSTDIAEQDDAQALAHVHANLAVVAELAGRLAERQGAPAPSVGLLDLLPADPVARSYLVTARVPLATADRYAALSAIGPVDRLSRVASALDDVAAALRFQLQ
ncbi:LON peptidase substrate-binding domain-containing protein [Skermania piniformis]